MNKDVVVSLKNVSKRFFLSKRQEYFFAVKNINLSLKKGDSIGIIGNNGSGKTTLLKIISGVTRPTSGIVRRLGKIVLLANLEDGFRLELSGRENIFLNGLLIGMTRREVFDNMNKIIDYSGIGEFIDEPFYAYSSGMKFRLAFSVAIASKCDVLIIDEVLTVGDFDFQQKVFSLLNQVRKENKDLVTIMCSHVPDFIWGFSKKYFVMNGGVLENLSKRDMVAALKSKRILWDELFNLRF
jgi:lipopolysaccharide transport system ATP-binding protein